MDYTKFKNRPAIYMIICTANKKCYIGSAVKLRDRINRHQNNLLKQTHASPKLQAAYNKYGKESFEVRLMEECDKEVLIQREQHYIDILSPQLNTCLTAGSPARKKLSAEHRAKISKGLMGRPVSKITRQRLSAAHKKKKMPLEAVEKIRKSKLGKKQSEESIAKRARDYAFVSPDGKVYQGSNLKRFCEEHGLSRPNMKKVLTGERKSHHGYTLYNP